MNSKKLILIVIFSQFAIFILSSSMLAAEQEDTKVIRLQYANLYINNIIKDDRFSNTCYVYIMLNYIHPTFKFKSDCTSYRINVSKKKYYKLGGFEYDENMCTGKSMRYEIMNWRDEEFFSNPDKWLDLDNDPIAQKIYEKIKNKNQCK